MSTVTIGQAARNFRRSALIGIFTTACMLLLTATNAKAAIYYVSIDGSDENPGTIDQPFRSIRKGTASLNAGDTLNIRGGTFDEIIQNWDFLGGSPENHTIIAGYQNENPVIRCTNCPQTVVMLLQGYTTVRGFTIDAVNTSENGLCAILGANVVFEQMTCLNAARDGVRVIGENTTIRDSYIKDCGRIQTDPQDTKGLGIHANNDGGGSTTSNLLVERNLIEGCRAGGIAVHQEPRTTNVVVRDNVIRNFGTRSTWAPQEGFTPQIGHGIIFGHGSYYYALNNLVIDAGPGSGNGYLNRCFHIWGDGRGHASFFWFLNNTCHGVDIGIQTWNETNNITAANNIFSNVQYVELLRGTNNTNSNYITNPIFVNAAAGDFRLQAGSPGVDVGANLLPVNNN